MPRALKTGEVRLGQAPTGERVFERINERGEHERGVMLPPSQIDAPGVSGVLSLGEQLDEPGLYRVKSFHAFTARGPAQVSSTAYRSGWDRVFGKEAN